MNFLEAVKAMKEGKKVKRAEYRAIKNIGHIVYADDDSGDSYPFSFHDFDATDWEIVEEKKTLSDKIIEPADLYRLGTERPIIKVSDVKEAIKELLVWQKEKALYCDAVSFERKVKEKFGERLVP